MARSRTLARRAIQLPVMGAGGAPAISVSPSSWDFGSTPVGTPVSKEFTITNNGTSTLEITLPITSDNAAFTITAQPGVTTLAPGTSTTFTVEADPSDIHAYSGNISIVTNAEGSPTIIAVEVEGVPFSGFNYFDAASDVYSDSALTTPIADGGLVGGWLNKKAGGGTNMTQAGAVRPFYRAHGFAPDMPAMEYSGTQQLRADQIAVDDFAGVDEAYSLCMIIKNINLATTYQYFGVSSAGNAQIVTGTNNTPNFVNFRDDDGINRQAQTGGTPEIGTAIVTQIYTGTAFTLRINGNVIINNATMNNGQATFTTLAFGALPDPSITFPWKGLLGNGFIGNRVMTAGEIATAEALLASKCGLSYPFGNVTIDTPKDYQIFQRDGSDQATISITGKILIAGTYNVEARWSGGAWTQIATGVSATYSGSLTSQNKGQGTLEVRLASDTTKVASKIYVGIGDIFAVAGQSNNANRATNPQMYSGAFVPSVYANDNTWKELRGGHDSGINQIDTVSDDAANGTGNSWYPLLATQIMAQENCPVAFIPCAMGGTGIVSWLPNADHLLRSTLYGSMNYRIGQAGGTIKAVLWWQGETDALASMNQATYNGHLDTIANAIQTDRSIKLMPCLLQNSSGIADVQESPIRLATSEAWGDNANVLVGPDFSDIASDDSFHLQSDAKCQIAADRWFAAIDTAFY